MVPVRQSGALRLPKLTNAGRTKNLKGGAINFLVACLAPGPCLGACARAQTTPRDHFGGNKAMVGGKLSAPKADPVGAFAPTPLGLRRQHRWSLHQRWISRKTERLSVRPGRFGDLKDREMHSPHPSGRRRVKSLCNLFLASDFGRMPDESLGSLTVEKSETRRWA
jgi:hypothetical protein